jgi:hypothetical protein
MAKKNPAMTDLQKFPQYSSPRIHPAPESTVRFGKNNHSWLVPRQLSEHWRLGVGSRFDRIAGRSVELVGNLFAFPARRAAVKFDLHHQPYFIYVYCVNITLFWPLH